MTINGSVTRTTGTMSERESLRAFCDGAKKSASAVRELAKELDNSEWIKTAEMLDAMRLTGIKLTEMKSMSRLETLMAANIKSDPKRFLNN